MHRKVRLSLEEAALGCTKVLRGKGSSVCAACTGAGWLARDGACVACDGAGELRQSGWFGLFGSPIRCAACDGTGANRQPCNTCDGSGKHETSGYRVTVRLPPGVRTGDELHVDGRRMRPGQSPGDLLIRVEVAAHAFFKLQDDGTVRCELPVSGFAWMANRSVQVPTFSGLQNLALNRDLLDYRLAGQGFPVERRGARGDLLVHIVPRFPDRLSTDQQILIDQLVATSTNPDGPAPDPALAAWQQTLRDWVSGLGPR